MSTEEKAGTYGPSWLDVYEYLEATEKALDGRVSFEIQRRVGKEPGKRGLDVAVRLVRPERPIGKQFNAVSARRWPHPDHKTMPGLLLWLLHDITELELERMEKERAKHQIPLPF